MKRLFTIAAAGALVLGFGVSGAAASPGSGGTTVDGLAQSAPLVTFSTGWLEREVLGEGAVEPKRRYKRRCYKRCKRSCKRIYKCKKRFRKCRRRGHSMRKCLRKRAKCKKRKRKCKKRCKRRCRKY
jgi:hypothetical protein